MFGGTATPNSKVEVFENPGPCSDCGNGKVFLGETYADNTGAWSFTGAYSSPITAKATTTDGATGEFAIPLFETNQLIYDNPVCNLNNGYIRGMKFISGTRYYWVKNWTDTVFNQLDLENLGPGYYVFVVEQTKYCSKTYSVSLSDHSPKISTQFMQLGNPSCGKANGEIRNVGTFGNYTKLYWLNENRDTVGRDLWLSAVGEGKYRLIVLNTTYGCGDSTNWISLVNQPGPSIDVSNVQINTASCSQPNGSIKNIVANNVTGTGVYRWVDSLNRVVSTNADLLNVLPGKYRLKFRDDRACDTVFTAYYIVGNLGGIVIDTTGKQLKPSGCALNNGSIKNIKVTGADRVEWINIVTNTVVGVTTDITGLAPGSYQLRAYNAMACDAQSPVIAIVQTQFLPIAATSTKVKDANCNENNGSISVLRFDHDSTGYSFRWEESVTHTVVAPGISLSNIGNGTYLLIATDANGCEKQVFSANIKMNDKPVLDNGQLQVTPENCSAKNGAVKGLSWKGLLGPTTYEWYDDNGKLVGSSATIQHVSGGNYRLKITDAGSCVVYSDWYAVNNTDVFAYKPLADDVVTARYTTAVLKVKNVQADVRYQLFSDPAGAVLLENTTGIFTTASLPADKDFYIRAVQGSCNSSFVKLHVAVVDETKLYIPNAFSPNNDHKNDQWNVTVSGILTTYHIRIYNRWGQPVYESTDVSRGWDGKFKGNDLPVGAYYWTIAAKDFFGKTISRNGSVLILR
jgi:gliding motility-associated-like protein